MFKTLGKALGKGAAKAVGAVVPDRLLPSQKNRDVLMTAGGMAALLAGRKVVGLSMFAKGAMGIERAWRAAHPEFEGGLVDRWDEAVRFYEATHQDDTNRKLHIVGIPMILGGAAGLLIFAPYRPLWFVSASSFSAGWVLNIVGHAFFEKNAPAFADDPLSFLAGPLWDFNQLRRRGGGSSVKEEGAAVEPTAVLPPEPSRINVGGQPAVA